MTREHRSRCRRESSSRGGEGVSRGSVGTSRGGGVGISRSHGEGAPRGGAVGRSRGGGEGVSRGGGEGGPRGGAVGSSRGGGDGSSRGVSSRVEQTVGSDMPEVENVEVLEIPHLPLGRLLLGEMPIDQPGPRSEVRTLLLAPNVSAVSRGVWSS
ncbi:uncharacterized protein LOC133737665 [Rosa rugosa]|uniref:uncharacterized protein LOC133737665 n=1 Tax=Rosa rugosa TaxID=74645 RepID=UPI002B40A64F|nr:uncharacterized protein LOC133737665 [Rosa rugosa]